jgi:cytochrome c556
VKRHFCVWALVAAGAVLAMPLMAAPGDPIGARIAGYRDLGAAFKSVNDGVRRGSATPQQMQRLAGQISASARAQYGWFPAGSGPRSGVKTAAMPKIWTRPSEFRAAQDAFARQAQAFQRVAASGDATALRASARQLGASCKGCHDAFRADSD